MPQTRMFRDRVVSMEQTLERGEKHLEFLKAICKEVFPDFEYREHALDHERDLFTMSLEAADGRKKTVSWTRMVLFDAERLPSLLEEPTSVLGGRLRAFLREHASRSEIVVTFRHLEDGWVETPEPRREKRRRRGRDRGRPSAKREGARPPSGRPQPPPSSRPQPPPSGRPQPASSARPAPSGGSRPPSAGAAAPAASGGSPAPPGEGRRRRRRFRRRRGRGGMGPSPGPAPARTP
ncbi:MAG TPA: hypothetical protein VEO37_00955 [Thermoanaerobaculia bacterium]|nr:hypothetical protein [Thermoanaerobaculia bacterium]